MPIIKSRKKEAKKLETKIEFSFEEQEDLPEINVDMKLKTKKSPVHIKIVKNKKKIKDVSINLF